MSIISCHVYHILDLEDAELLLWALQCIVDFAGAVASLVDDEFGTSDTTLVVPRWVDVDVDADGSQYVLPFSRLPREKKLGKIHA